MRVKFLATISLSSLAIFLIQFVLFSAFFARWVFDLIIMWIAGFHYSPGETFLDKSLYWILMVMTYPIRFLLRKSSFDDGSFIHTVLLLAVNSVIWGIGVGTLIYAFSELARRKRAA